MGVEVRGNAFQYLDVIAVFEDLMHEKCLAADLVESVLELILLVGGVDIDEN